MRFKCCTRIRGCVRGHERGFTIVEMMMTMFMSAIVLIAIAVIVTGSHKYLINGRAELRLQQDFSLISLVLWRNIAEGISVDHEIYASYADYVAAAPPQSSGTCLKLYFPSGDSTILYKDNSDFIIMNTDSTFTNLVPGVLDSLIFTAKTNSVETKLSLSQGKWSLEQTLLAAFRNSTVSVGGGGGGGNLGNRRCELVIQSSEVPANLSDFPLLLTAATLPSEMFDADGSNPALDGGGDIKFSSDEAGATRLSCEIVTFTTDNNPANGKAEIWVKVPSVSSSSNTSVWVWYDSTGQTQPAASAAYGSESVWDANYKGIWHLKESATGAADEFADATNNANHGQGVEGLGNRKCELVIQSSKVPASLTDFAVLLTDTTLPSEMFDADGANPALNGGGDIRFSSDAAGATRLSCEIVTFTTDNNPALGTAEIWVKVPSVSSSSNTSIWVWYDQAGASQPDSNAAFGSQSVWDANYVGVWHLVMISSYSDGNLVREAIEKGAYTYLFKPLNKLDIFSVTVKSLKNTGIDDVFSFK